MHIVLGKRKHTVLVIFGDNLGSTVAAAEVSNLETFINRTTALDLHFTGTGNEAPAIQVATAVDHNIAVFCHLDKADGTNRHTVRTVLSGLLTGQADSTVNCYVSAACHIQGAISRRLGIYVNNRRFCCSKCMCTIVRNLQCDASRNSVVAGCQCGVTCQNNRLIGSAAGIADGCIQTFKQLCGAIGIEHRCRRSIGKNSFDSHIRCGNQLIGSCGREHRIVCRIDPCHKLAAAAGNCNKTATGCGTDSVHRAGSYGSAVKLYAAQAAVCNCHIGFSSCCLYLEVT